MVLPRRKIKTAPRERKGNATGPSGAKMWTVYVEKNLPRRGAKIKGKQEGAVKRGKRKRFLPSHSKMV